jgi:beta-lactamase regulating signal transducer with metallopeptidase domain
LLSLLIPLIKIESFKNVVSSKYMMTLPEVLLGNQQQKETSTILLDPVVITQKSFWTWEIIFFLGALFALFLLGFKVFKMGILLRKNPKQKIENFYIVKLVNSNAAFSFFKFIFLGDQIKNEDKNTILKHEIVHVKQFHSLDLLFFEILRILFWFNPLTYMYQNRMVTLHEYIADAHAVNPENKKAYYENLLSQVFDTKKISFINTFFKQSLIKKRIVMLQKSKSKQVNLLKYALLIPLVFFMLVYASCTSQEKINKEEKSVEDLISELQARINTKGLTGKEYLALSQLTANYKEYENTKVVYKTTNISEVDVPFAVIETPPAFPGCEALEKLQRRKCFSQNVSEHVNRNFNTKIASEHNLTGKQRINVIFKIDKEGNVTGVRSRAPHPALEEEAKRVINLLPKMIPGEQKGKKVNVPYSLPIIFQVADNKPGLNTE